MASVQGCSKLAPLGTSVPSLTGIDYLPSSMVLIDGKQNGPKIDLQTPAAKFDLLNPSDFLKGTTPSSVANINHLPCKLALDTDKQKRSIVDSSAPAAPTGSLPSNKPSTQQGKNIGINKPESHGKEKVIMTINGNGGFPALLQPILPMDSSNISVS